MAGYMERLKIQESNEARVTLASSLKVALIPVRIDTLGIITSSQDAHHVITRLTITC